MEKIPANSVYLEILNRLLDYIPEPRGRQGRKGKVNFFSPKWKDSLFSGLYYILEKEAVFPGLCQPLFLPAPRVPPFAGKRNPLTRGKKASIIKTNRKICAIRRSGTSACFDKKSPGIPPWLRARTERPGLSLLELFPLLRERGFVRQQNPSPWGFFRQGSGKALQGRFPAGFRRALF